jgi:hypothetical protein
LAAAFGVTSLDPAAWLDEGAALVVGAGVGLSTRFGVSVGFGASAIFAGLGAPWERAAVGGAEAGAPVGGGAGMTLLEGAAGPVDEGGGTTGLGAGTPGALAVIGVDGTGGFITSSTYGTATAAITPSTRTTTTARNQRVAKILRGGSSS